MMALVKGAAGRAPAFGGADHLAHGIVQYSSGDVAVRILDDVFRPQAPVAHTDLGGQFGACPRGVGREHLIS